ncbi:C-C motif chemokine 2-like isoform X4 [Sebastes umbrosus]|uniref:C-C motif chemokine 2-like isoform X4 n=1 Tax=Sebastes umbrosus TaxID=72105 RepID=UPI00189D97EE|nr:C-C motif chemokine 2-like isoform X4 [Sebastes umbrosus]
MYSIFQPSAYCVGGLKKGLQSRNMHHICFSQRYTMTSLAFVSLLLVAIVVSTASAQGGAASCCRKLSETRIHRDLLKSYYKQDKSSCPINAVVFTTLKGIRICANPNKVWTKTSMAYLDGNNGQR